MTPKICSFDGCDRPRRTRQWCNSHSRQVERHGLEGLRPIGAPRAPKPSPVCRVGGCGRAVMGRGLCSGHLRRDREGLPLGPIRGRAQKATCVADGCAALTESATGVCPRCREKLRRLGQLPGQVIVPCTGPGCDKPGFGDPAMCESHKRQWRETGTVWEVRRAVVGCAFAGCDRDHAAKGYCHQHARQLRDRAGARLTPIGQRETRACTIVGCTGEHVARGLCRRHYNAAHYKAAVYGSILKPPKRERAPKPVKVAKPGSNLPDGWFAPARKPTPPPPVRGNTTIEDALMALPLKPSPEQAERCLANLATWGALDLAEMLGLEAA